MHSPINYPTTPEGGRQRGILLCIKNNRNVHVIVKRSRHLIVITLGTTKRQVVILRNVPTIGVLRIVVKLDIGKHIHDIPRALHLDGFPTNIARQVKTEGGTKIHPVSLSDTRVHILHHIGKEHAPRLKETLRLCDSRVLRTGKLAVPRRIETRGDATRGRGGTHLVSTNRARRKVQTERQIPQTLALFELRIRFREQHQTSTVPE